MSRFNLPLLGVAILVTLIGTAISLIWYPNWLALGLLGPPILVILIFTEVPKRLDALRMFLKKPGKNLIGAQLAQELYSLIEDFENQFKNIFYEGEIINEEQTKQASPLLKRYNETRKTLNDMWRVGKTLKPFVKWENKIDESLNEVDRQLQGYKNHIDAYLAWLEQEQHSASPFNPPIEVIKGKSNEVREVFGEGRSHRLSKVAEQLTPMKELLSQYVQENTRQN